MNSLLLLIKNINVVIFLGFASAFFVQHLLKKNLPYTIKGQILVSSLAGVLVGFRVTSVRAQACQAAWLAAEEKHTYLTENDTNSE